MSAIVTDTHALLWYLMEPDKLSAAAAAAFRAATGAGEAVLVPSICLVEVTYLVERRRIPPIAHGLIRSSLSDTNSAFELVVLDVLVADAVDRIPRADVPDMPDRIIAATALARGVPLVTRDARIRASSVATIW